MFALIDCNNFYIRCERAFQPILQNKAGVVLSNNDGCAIARSQEAKDLGIKMGAPYFQLKDTHKGVWIRSSPEGDRDSLIPTEIGITFK